MEDDLDTIVNDRPATADWAGLSNRLAAMLDGEITPGASEIDLGRVGALAAVALAIAVANANANAAAAATVNVDLDDDDPVLTAPCVFLRTERTIIALSRSVEWRSFTFQAPIIDVIPKCGGILAFSRSEAVFFRCLDGVFVPTPALAAQPLPGQLGTDGQPITDGQVTCWAA